MISHCLLLAGLICHGWSRPAHSTTGIRFVFGIPATDGAKYNMLPVLATIYVSTEEHFVNVQLFLPNNAAPLNALPNEDSVSVDDQHKEDSNKTIISKILTFQHSVKFEIGAEYAIEEVGLSKAITLRASGPVRAWIVMWKQDFHYYHANNAIVRTTSHVKYSESFRLIPETSCSSSYYVNTVTGYPFVMVISFGYRQTEVHVKPMKEQVYAVRRAVCKNKLKGCPFIMNGHKIKLGQYQAWYLYLKTKNGRLHNTQLISDMPIFVVAGNLRCILGDKSADICVSAMKPKVTLGKEYFVPSIPAPINSLSKPKRILCVNANSNSFDVTLHFQQPSNPTRVTFTKPIYNYTVFDQRRFLVVSTQPFGLNVFIVATMPDVTTLPIRCATVMDVLPLSQWMYGSWFQREYPHDTMTLHEMITVAHFNNMPFYKPKQRLVLNQITKKLDHNNKTTDWLLFRMPHSSQRWKDGVYEVNDTEEYTISTLRLTTHNDIQGYTKSPLDRVMMYWFGNHTSRLMAMSWDFHLTPFTEFCVKSKSEDDDGIDNDCDGSVDEELDNGTDDDQDGEIDEDCRSIYRDGKWSAWTTLCNKHKMTVRVRSCTLIRPSRFGRYCRGESLQCNGGECERMDIVTAKELSCVHSEGCAKFDDQEWGYIKDNASMALVNRRYTCPWCLPGYQALEYCQSKCPFPWHGQGCNEITPTHIHSDKEHMKDKKSSIKRFLEIVTIMGANVMAIAVVIIFVWGFRLARASLSGDWHSSDSEENILPKESKMASVEMKRSHKSSLFVIEQTSSPTKPDNIFGSDTDTDPHSFEL